MHVTSCAFVRLCLHVSVYECMAYVSYLSVCLSVCMYVCMYLCACMYVFYIFEYILYVCRVLT